MSRCDGDIDEDTVASFDAGAGLFDAGAAAGAFGIWMSMLSMMPSWRTGVTAASRMWSQAPRGDQVMSRTRGGNQQATEQHACVVSQKGNATCVNFLAVKCCICSACARPRGEQDGERIKK